MNPPKNQPQPQSRPRPSLNALLGLDAVIDVVDIGASPLSGSGAAPYKRLLDAGHARVVGFEPDAEQLAKLNAQKGPNERYIGQAVYDGAAHELKICRAAGMTSLLEPNRELLDYFHGFPEWGEVLKRVPVDTVRLDDVVEITNIDYLKIDIQGGELEVFRNGTRLLSDGLVIHTEVEFLPMYLDQPLFADVDLFLRDLGFVFHRFQPLTSRVIKPLAVNNDIYAGLSQAFWADAVFVRDFTKFDALDERDLHKTALILHDIYGSYDLALRALMASDAKTGGKLAETYLAKLN